MTSKIVWTSREWRQIAEHLVQNAVVPEEHGWRGSLITAMKTVLPADRWREPANLSMAKGVLVPLMKTTITSPQHKPILPPEPRLPGIKDFSTEDLLVELARRVAKLLEPQVTHNPVDRGFHPPPKHDPNPSLEKVKVKLPTIWIVGPKGQQQTMLQQHFEGMLNLTFLTCEDNPARLGAAAAADEIILWTRFMNHSHQDKAKEVAPRRCWMANSMDDILKRLTLWSTR